MLEFKVFVLKIFEFVLKFVLRFYNLKFGVWEILEI